MIHTRRYSLAIKVLLVVCCATPLLRAASSAADLEVQYNELSQEFSAAHAEWRPIAPASGRLIFIAPDEYAASENGGKQIREARNRYADALYGLAKQAADAGQSSLAFQWATETLRENPDHADARRVLGYDERGGKWLTPYGVKMQAAGKVWNNQQGWIAEKDSKSPATITEAKSGRRAEMKNGWQVRTDHFLVTTNHSLAAGAELAARLERLFQVWRQLFAGFYYSQQEIRGLFSGERIARIPARQFRVFYHRDRDDYTKALVRRQPLVADTLGIYFDETREAHFFAVAAGGSPAENSTGEPPVATLYHEAVHQLFQESKSAGRRIGETANFWVIEGVATYFETLTEHANPQAGRYFTIGERTAGRLPAARDRLNDNYYIPLAELTQLGKDDVQRRPDIMKLYSQASGLTAFLLDGEKGRYRESLVRYLQAVYAGRGNDQTLAEAAGTSYPELDAAYRRFMGSLP